jgi:hypothetical protein
VCWSGLQLLSSKIYACFNSRKEKEETWFKNTKCKAAFQTVGQLLQQNGAFGLMRRSKSQNCFKSLLT